MGQVLRRLNEFNHLHCDADETGTSRGKRRSLLENERFPDLATLPPELSLTVLSYLNPTDLCLASCVWGHLANDEALWHGLCTCYWGCTSIYSKARHISNFSYKRLFLLLDEASLTFNGDPFDGMDYLFDHGIVDDNPREIALFFYSTKKLLPERKRLFLNDRRDVLNQLLKLYNFQGQFLPNALRQFFTECSAPNERGNYLSEVIELFSAQFVTCNPNLGLSQDTVFVLCFSLIMLSVDLASPHVKNKMSKREFIKNTCRAAAQVSCDLAGHLYDNIYLAGHVAPSSS